MSVYRYRTRRCVVWFGWMFLTACGSGEPVDSTAAVAQVNAIADELLEHRYENDAYVRMQSGLPVTKFNGVSLELAQQEARINRDRLARLDAIPIASLPHEQQVLAKILRHAFASGAQAEQGYWLEFVVTPHASSFNFIGAGREVLATRELRTTADLDNYLHLLDEYGAMLDQVVARTLAQAERGILVPKPAIPGVLTKFQELHTSAADTFSVAPARLESFSAEQSTAFKAAVIKRIRERIAPGYARITALFDDAYRSKAPDEVGLGQYPGGKSHYLHLIETAAGLDLTPEQIHELGLKQVDEIDRQMQEIRDQLGFQGSREEFHQRLRKDPRFLAQTPAQVEQRFLKYMAQIEPHLPRYFEKLPQAPYRLKRLDPAEEPGVSYGYYQAPTPADPVGYYYYNGADLDQRPLLIAQHLIYHEFLPGHHLQVVLEQENKSIHPVREFLYHGAFVEGWAEYAASLGREMGLYDDPYERYGHLALQAIIAVYTVADTGMNYFGWPLEKARQYMRDHTVEIDSAILPETLRFSTDIPGQAIEYLLGYQQFWKLRRRAEAALGDAFDIRVFHDAAVGNGGAPLDVLEEHIDWFIARQRRSVE